MALLRAWLSINLAQLSSALPAPSRDDLTGEGWLSLSTASEGAQAAAERMAGGSFCIGFPQFQLTKK